MSRITNALTQAAQIKPQLNRPDDWVEWNRKLNGTLAIANLWKVLTGDKAPPANEDESCATWEDNQESLYRYGATLTDEATRMRFPMTMKSKDAICKESKIVFNKIEAYTGKKMQYFRSDDAGEYQLLVPYFEEKGIIWEKSAPYAQD